MRMTPGNISPVPVDRVGICHTVGSNLVRQRLTNQALSTSSPYQSGAHDWLADHIFREISRITPLIFWSISNSGEPATKLGNCGANDEISDIKIQDRRSTLEWAVVAAMKLFDVLFAVTHREASRPGKWMRQVARSIVPNQSLQREQGQRIIRQQSTSQSQAQPVKAERQSSKSVMHLIPLCPVPIVYLLHIYVNHYLSYLACHFHFLRLSFC